MADDDPKYLRTVDGYLFHYSPELAGRSDLEPVTEEEAYPERNMPEHVAKKAKAKAEDDDDDEEEIDLGAGITEESGAEKPKPTDPALAKQAGKGLPK